MGDADVVINNSTNRTQRNALSRWSLGRKKRMNGIERHSIVVYAVVSCVIRTKKVPNGKLVSSFDASTSRNKGNHK